MPQHRCHSIIVIAFGTIVGLSFGDLPRAHAGGGATFLPFDPSITFNAVSVDGQVLVGFRVNEPPRPLVVEPCYWTSQTGVVGLGWLPGATFLHGEAFECSSDGSVIVGQCVSGQSGGNNREAFRWTAAGGMVGLGDLPGSPFNSYAQYVTGDGMLVVGRSSPTFLSVACKWQIGVPGPEALPVAAGSTGTTISDISWDGTHMAGVAAFSNGLLPIRMFYGSIVFLGILPGWQWGNATAMSNNGLHIAGVAFNGTEYRAFRYHSSTGLVELPGSATNFQLVVTAITNDGSRIFFDDGATAKVWDASRGIRDLKTMLIDDYGLTQLADWTLRRTNDITPDGSTLVGRTNNSQGGTQHWRVTLPTTNSDTDHDGLPNSWESEGQGLDVNSDGIIDLDLYALGARPDRRDIFVEIDALAGQDPANLQPVIQAFANAPADPRGGSAGITLHLQIDENDLPLSTGWTPGLTFDIVENLHSLFFGTAAQRIDSNSQHILAAKERVYRYCVYSHSSDGSYGGLAYSNPTNWFVVAKSHFVGDPVNERAIFMHELGHALGLDHGGNDDLTAEPNYISVMNYLYSLPFNAGEAWRLDYSRGTMPPIIENNINEATMLTDATGHNNGVLTYFPQNTCSTNPCDPLTPAAFPALGYYIGSGPKDFNGDIQVTSGVCMDLDYYGTTPPGGDPSPCQTLDDYNDWANLHYAPPTADANAGTPPNPPIELTIAQIEQLMKVLPGPPCLPDIDVSGVVDVDDLLAVINAWGPCPSLPSLCNADIAPLPVNGAVDVDDLISVILHWGDCP